MIYDALMSDEAPARDEIQTSSEILRNNEAPMIYKIPTRNEKQKKMLGIRRFDATQSRRRVSSRDETFLQQKEGVDA